MNTRPITMSLMGGLGNQLFQFATGLEVAHRAGTWLQLDLGWFSQSRRRAPDGLVLRPYELAGVAEGVPVLPLAASRRGEWAGHARDVLVRRGGRLVNRLPLGLHAEAAGGFDPRVLSLAPGSHLRGYYASWRYFPGMADVVRERVLRAPEIGHWARERAVQAEVDGALALHVRRGDYLSMASTHGHVRPQYHDRALRVLRGLGMDGPVWLFSDEPRAARAWLGETVPVDRVIEPPVGASALDSLVVMASARGLVMANSTYSWWAGFLRDQPERPVVAPRPMWALPGVSDDRDLLLPHWITVDCREFS